jgi:hypothetical protein
MSKTTDQRNKLIGRLFKQDNSEPGPMKYIVKEGLRDEAASTWQEHGVCLECSTRSITGGRCIQCGWESEALITRHKAYAEACRCVRCGEGGIEKPATNPASTPAMAEALGVPQNAKVCDDCLFAIFD